MDYKHLLGQARTLYQHGKFGESAKLCKQYLRLRPRDVDAVRLYGEVASAMGLYSEAFVIYQKLLQIAPDDGEALCQLARQSQAMKDEKNARKYAERALSVLPSAITPRLVLGAVELNQGNEEAGYRQLESAREQGAGDEIVDAIRLDHLLASGKFDAAVVLLRDMIARTPDDGSLYGKLSRSKKFKEGDPDIELIRGLLDDAGEFSAAIRANADALVEANLALYKVEADLGNYALAFGYLDASKQPFRHSSSALSAEQIRGQYEGQKHLFTRAFVEKKAPLACQADDPIFVVGMPRSGTTLLERVLATNPDLVPAGELVTLDRVQQEVCARVGRDQNDLGALARVPDKMWVDIGAEYIKRARDKLPTSKYFVDKLPGNFANLGFIKSVLPRARIIHLYRHPAATCFSIYEQNFAFRHSYNYELESLANTYLAYSDLMEHWRSEFPDGFVELNYESLVTEPEATISRLGEELDLDLDVAALASSQSSGSIHTASFWQARQPVNRQSVDRWEHFCDELAPLLKVLEPVMPGAPHSQ